MFTNRRPPPKSPAGTTVTSASPSLAPSHDAPTPMTLSDRIKTQVRARPVIQTKVQTVVKTITRPIMKSTSTTTNKNSLNATANGKGTSKPPPANGNASTTKKGQKKVVRSNSRSTSTSAKSDRDDSDTTSSTRRKRAKPSNTATVRRKRSRSSSVSSVGNAGGYDSTSSLSSADEDYFSGRLGNMKPKVVEGTPVCVRNVAAKSGDLAEAQFNITSSESVVRNNLGAYIVDFFADPTNPQATAQEWCGQDLPILELEYPAVGAKEKFVSYSNLKSAIQPQKLTFAEIGNLRFALVAPKRNDEYNPIEDLMVTIETILENYLTPAQALSHFGYTPGSSFSSFASFLKPLSQHNNSSTSSNSNSRSSSPAIHNIGSPKLSTPEPSTVIPVAPSALSPSISTSSQPPSLQVVEPLLRSLEKARNRRDGPTFFSHIAHFNSTLRSLKEAGTISINVSTMPGLREKLWTKIFHQCYDRTVGPDIEELRRYAAFSDNVYGELLPKFMNEIFEKTGKILGPGKTFIDLGSGVGNCVVQAALATGADSYGFENMQHASHLARLQLKEAKERFLMWGLNSGPMECVEADFCENSLVPKVLKKADLVLVNNEVFTASLNDKLAYLFLDLPDDCYLVSLKPFLPPSFKLSSHNLNHPLAYLSQTREMYRPGSVSWKMEGGSYYIAKVERGKLEKWVRRQEEKESERKRDREDKRSRRSVSTQAMSRSGSRQQ